MLGWIFKKKSGDAPAAAPKAADKRPAPAVVPTAAPPKAPKAPPAPAVDWAGRLAQARRDDDALLALAQTAGVPLAIKQAAVDALAGEAALQRAEREFRNRDRRVHQAAKRRLVAMVAGRETREQAAGLIEAARQWAGKAEMPLNRGVELDRAWQALDPAAIEPAQREAFAALTAQLAAQAREQTDRERQRKRWQADAARAQHSLRAACEAAAEGTQDRGALAAALQAAQAVSSAGPAADAALESMTQAALAGLGQALQLAVALDAHLAELAALEGAPQGPVMATAGPAEEALPAQAAPLPPLSDPRLAALIEARRARWRQDQDHARQEAQQHRRDQARERQRSRQDEQGTFVAEALGHAEAALDAGQLADAHGQLSHIDEVLQGREAPEPLRARLAAVQARLAQLRGWQHWAGGRARDELVAQAEALAAATAKEAAQPVPDAPAEPAEQTPAAAEAAAEVARLSIRQRADVIATLRQRWQEIDRLGGAGGRALWLRFDAALKTASEPLAAHAAVQRAQRAANLETRNQLLDGLESVLPEVLAGSDEATAPAPPQMLAAALERFRVEWRKLGPVEHTVPRAAQAALVARMDAAVRRVDEPLQAARRAARVEREALVARARALSDPGRDRGGAGDVRELQAEWQRHAKALTLSRADERALWTDFKTAIDAVFAAREAAFHARDAEFEAHAAEREALIERLRVSPDDSPQAQRRILAEVDVAWQRCGPAPRARAQALETAFRIARETLRQWLDSAAQRAWQSVCDALDAKLALCKARESPPASEPVEAAALATLAESWQLLPALPAPLEAALRQRAGLTPAAAEPDAAAVDEGLLQIEMAWDLPTPPAFEAARRERKLLALKTALEGRRVASPEALAPDQALALLLRCSRLEPGPRERVDRVLAAWRQRGPRAQA